MLERFGSVSEGVFSKTDLAYFSVLFSYYSFETQLSRNNEQFERRTSNVQHRTSNIDDAALYLF
jgi:hypothetical protein